MNTSFGDETICQICGKPAIGLEILGCCKAVVCFDHASPTLRKLARGRRYECGVCYYYRY